MARYGIIADLHGNREALAAALAALQARGIDVHGGRLACLGDIVGYNADPDECAAALSALGAPAIASNHDLIGLGRLDFRRCSNEARYALKRTRRVLTHQTRAYLAGLPATRVLEGSVVLVHGGVRDVQLYMKRPALIARNAAYLREDFPGARLCFFGHSHEQKVFEVDGNAVRELPAGEVEAAISLERDKLYFVNPGSVDAARKRGPKLAECAILDTRAWTLEFLRTRYDAAASEAKAAAFGYRIDPWTDRLYTLGRRLARLAARAQPRRDRAAAAE